MSQPWEVSAPRVPISVEHIKLQAGGDIWIGRPGRYHRITFHQFYLSEHHGSDATWGLREPITYGPSGNQPAWTNFLLGFRHSGNTFQVEWATGNGTYAAKQITLDCTQRHTYSVHWHDDHVKWYVDNNEIHHEHIKATAPLSGLLNAYQTVGTLNCDSVVLE